MISAAIAPRIEVPCLVLEDATFVNDFLDLKARKGSHAMAQFRYTLFRFLTFTGKSALHDIDEQDVLAFFAHLEETGVCLGTKKVNRARLMTFFKAYERKARRMYPGYYNPVPPLEECSFSPDRERSMVEEQQHERELCFTPEQILFLLKKVRLAKPRFFMALTLLTTCGMRLSECLTIRLENLNIAERYLMTGIEENARKSGIKAYFPFPEEVATLLAEYVLEVKARNPHTPWLFPGSNGSHLATKTLHNFLAGFGFPFPVKSHSFRRSLETYQVRGIKMVPLHIVELLSNHAITSVVMRHYAKIPIEERRKLYDAYFPPEYDAILAWFATL